MGSFRRLGWGFAGRHRVLSLALASALVVAGLVTVPVRAVASPRAPEPAVSPSQLTPANAYESFVQATYHDFMERLPDNQGLANWSTALAHGSPMEQYLRWMSTSDEWLGALVTKMYQDTLQRDPDPTGLYEWKRTLGTGQHTVAQVASFFYASDEYYTLHAGDSPSSFVTSLYQKLLNRDPDPLGLAYWVDQTNNPQFGRTWVAYNFYQSDESRVDRVTALYQKLLSRGPDPVGLAFWKVQVLSTGDLALASQIAGSQEYWEKALVRFPSVIPEPVIVTDVLPGATTGQPYTTTLEGTGGVPPYTWWAGTSSDGSFSLDPSTGVFSGTPHFDGTLHLVIQMTDAAKRTVTKWVSWPVLRPLAITTTGLPNGAAGSAYAATVTGLGGTAPYTWSASGLPAGLTMSSTGVIGGSPTTVGPSSVEITLSDSSSPALTVTTTLPLTVDADLSARQISAGSFHHTCAVGSDGAVRCWGYNLYGQLGDGTNTSSAIPVNVMGLTSGVVAVAAGYRQTCALTTGGGVKCWGYNTNGELGDGTTVARSAPGDVVGLTSGVTAIAVGGGEACALTSAGRVKCWGTNGYGQLGNGAVTSSSTPVDVVGVSGATAIAVGPGFACAVTSAGVQCWGSNAYGQLGDGTTTDRAVPVTVAGLGAGVIALSAGMRHTCAVTSAGAQCWGGNSFGQLGDGTTTDRLSPVTVTGLGTDAVVAISLGGNSTCVVTSAGAAKCWGSNQYGNLGDGTTRNRATPADVVGLAGGVRGISAGALHTCAVTIGGRAECWGSNMYGALGDMTTTNRILPGDVYGIHGS